MPERNWKKERNRNLENIILPFSQSRIPSQSLYFLYEPYFQISYSKGTRFLLILVSSCSIDKLPINREFFLTRENHVRAIYRTPFIIDPSLHFVTRERRSFRDRATLLKAPMRSAVIARTKAGDP